MKKSIFFILFLFSSIGFAQDLLTKKNGEDISAQVLEVTITEIKYKKYDDFKTCYRPHLPTRSCL